jgi:crotonobetaine/carnitine-CoA ligase
VEAVTGGGAGLPSLGEWTTGAVLDRAARFGPDRTGVSLLGRDLTFGELDERANRVAGALAALGVGPGDRFAALMSNRTEYLELYHGSGRAGTVFVPIVTQSKLPEIEYFVGHSDSTVLFVDGGRWEVLRAALGDSGALPEPLRHVVLVGGDAPEGTLAYEELLAAAPPTPPDRAPQETDPIAFMYTSGTTGRPKAVIHSHRTAVAQAAAIQDRMGYSPDDRLMTIFPLFHGNALVWSALTATFACAPIFLTERFSASRFWDQVRECGATEVNLLIGAINMLLAQPPADRDRDHPLRTSVANFTKPIHDAFSERFGVELVTCWALAEGPLGTMTAPGFGYRPGLIGWPMGEDNRVRVVDEIGRDLPPGKVGELVQRNQHHMLGYFKNPEETARVLRDGWVHSGDLGYRGADGLFYFVGREKHVIRRSGENVSGEEVETCIATHPSVAEAAVIAVPDPVRGEEVKAFVILKDGESMSELDVVQWCDRHLADFKVPRYVEFRAKLPKTGTERVKRHELREEPGALDCWDRTSQPVQATKGSEER